MSARGGGGVVVRRKEKEEEAGGGGGGGRGGGGGGGRGEGAGGGGGVGGVRESIPEDGVAIAMLTSTLVTLGLRRASKGKMVSRWKMEKRVTYG